MPLLTALEATWGPGTRPQTDSWSGCCRDPCSGTHRVRVVKRLRHACAQCIVTRSLRSMLVAHVCDKRRLGLHPFVMHTHLKLQGIIKSASSKIIHRLKHTNHAWSQICLHTQVCLSTWMAHVSLRWYGACQHIHIPVYIYVCVFIFVRTHMHVYHDMHVCIWVCVYACMNSWL